MIVTILMIWYDVEQFMSGPTIVEKKPQTNKNPKNDKRMWYFLALAFFAVLPKLTQYRLPLVWFCFSQGYENCALEGLVKLKTEDGCTNKDNNPDVSHMVF